MCFLTNNFSINDKASDIISLFDNNVVVLLADFPLLVIIIDCLYDHFIKKEELNLYICLAGIIPIGCLISDICFKTFLTIPSYIVSMIFVYLYKSDYSLNSDSLTGLYNRRLFDHGYITKKIQNKKLIGIFLIDVDDFKNINDTFGHLYGDKILKDIGQILKSSIRATDAAIRFGGDEFLLVVTLNTKSELKTIYNKIQLNLNNYNTDVNPNKKPISISIGYDIYNQDIDLNEFIKKIDGKMYATKRKKKQ